MSDKCVVNPHFDQDRVVWRDEYSGLYQPVDYAQQFDYQWKLSLEKKIGFRKHPAVETSDPWIDDRIYELTGIDGYIERRKYGNVRYALLELQRLITQGFAHDESPIRADLEPKFSIDHFRGKRCLDVGCGVGRWTRTLLILGAKVKSIDPSEHALESTRRYNDDTEKLDLFDILEKRPDLHGVFDFTICWGVVQHTHDPKLGFDNVATTVKPGGQLYTMIYAPEGMHNSPKVIDQRRYYHRQLHTAEERLDYAYQISEVPGNVIGYLDMLNTFYNWVVPENVIRSWYEKHGFTGIVTLNSREKSKCAYHVLGTKR